MHLLVPMYLLFESIWIVEGSLLTWQYEPTTINVHSVVGRIDIVLKGVNLHHCATECSMDTRCVTIGYSVPYHACQLYSVDLAGFTSGLIPQSSTAMYKAICTNTDYTNIRALDTCVKRHTVAMTWQEARDECRKEGGDLLTMDNDQIREYLTKTLLNVPDVSYWVGGAIDNTTWEWVVTSENVTLETGAMFWAMGEPTTHHNCMELFELNGFLRFKASDCAETKQFICAF